MEHNLTTCFPSRAPAEAREAVSEYNAVRSSYARAHARMLHFEGLERDLGADMAEAAERRGEAEHALSELDREASGGGRRSPVGTSDALFGLAGARGDIPQR